MANQVRGAGPAPAATTAVPTGTTTRTMPFGTVSIARPAVYYVNRDRKNADRITGVNAAVVQLPILIANMGSLTVQATCYLNKQSDGSFQPKVSWPKAVAASDDFKARALAHVNAELKRWPSFQAALADAYRAVRAEELGKHKPVAADELAVFVPPSDEPPAEIPGEVVETVTTQETA